MTNNTTDKFMSPNGTFNTKAAMQAGHNARTEGLSILIRGGVGFLKTINLAKIPLTNLRTR